MSLEGPGHDVLTVDHRGLHETTTVCAVQADALSCSTDGGPSTRVEVTWVDTPSAGADLVDGEDHGWWEVDGDLLLPLDSTAHTVSEQPVTVNSAQAWDAGEAFSLTSVGGLGAGAALAILGVLASGLAIAAVYKRRRDSDQEDGDPGAPPAA